MSALQEDLRLDQAVHEAQLLLAIWPTFCRLVGIQERDS